MKNFLKEVERYQKNTDRKKYRIYLGQNERNTYLPEEVFDNFLSSIEQEDIFHYPDINPLKVKVASLYGVESENIMLTHGSDFGIKTIFDTFNVYCKNVVTSDYCFPMYNVYANVSETQVKKATYTNLNLDVNSIIELIDKDTQFVILANPNSPIGDSQSVENIKKILDTGVHLIVDEAYIELTNLKSSIELINEYENLTVLRTFSKAYGAAGLRVGVLISSKNNISNYYSKLRLMYPINSLGARYIDFIIKHHTFFLNYFKDISEGKKIFVEKLIEQGVEIRDTECSWVFIKQNQNGKDLSELLELQRIHHRTNSLPGEEGMWIKLNYEPIIKNHDFNFS